MLPLPIDGFPYLLICTGQLQRKIESTYKMERMSLYEFIFLDHIILQWFDVTALKNNIQSMIMWGESTRKKAVINIGTGDQIRKLPNNIFRLAITLWMNTHICTCVYALCTHMLSKFVNDDDRDEGWWWWWKFRMMMMRMMMMRNVDEYDDDGDESWWKLMMFLKVDNNNDNNVTPESNRVKNWMLKLKVESWNLKVEMKVES